MASAKKRANLKKTHVKPGPLGQLSKPSSSFPTNIEINYETSCLPTTENGLIESYIDNFLKSSYSTKTGALHLQFHILALHAKRAVQQFSLQISPLSGADCLHKEIKTIAISSPVMATNYPDLDWAKHCRFVVDFIIEVPNLASGDALSIIAHTNDSTHCVARLIAAPL